MALVEQKAVETRIDEERDVRVARDFPRRGNLCSVYIATDENALTAKQAILDVDAYAACPDHSVNGCARVRGRVAKACFNIDADRKFG